MENQWCKNYIQTLRGQIQQKTLRKNTGEGLNILRKALNVKLDTP